MAQIVEVGRAGGKVYGVSFVVCGNAEVVRLALGLEPESEADGLARMRDIGAAIHRAGFDYSTESDFKAYNGGPRLGLVDPVYHVADEPAEADESPEWVKTWQRGAGATPIPAEFAAKVDGLIEESDRYADQCAADRD